MKIRTGWHIGVAIPAKNEELLIGRCLESLLEARRAVHSDASVDVVVVSDCSDDHTANLARRALGVHGEVMEARAGCVGKARAFAVERLLKRSQSALRRRFWIANTDADCIIQPNWLAFQLELAMQGVEAVAGIISVDSFDEHESHVSRRFEETYLRNEDGTHPHVHGANLGVHAQAYLDAGGWTPLSTAEDHDLWKRLKALGACCLSTTELEIVTSGRRIGRAPSGFADALAAHNGTAA